MISIVFRFDDPSPCSDKAVECELISLLEARGLSASFATIPFSIREGKTIGIDPSNSPHILSAYQRGVIEVTQHGYSHEKYSKDAQGCYSEFYNRPQLEQEALIRKGRDQLADFLGEAPKGFTPPWNTGDAATLQALEKLGFDYISAAIPCHPSYCGPLHRLPRTCAPQNMDAALAEAKSFQMLNPIIVAVLHHYDFNQPNCLGFSYLQSLLDRIMGDPAIQVVTFSQLIKSVMPKHSQIGVKNILQSERAHWRIKALLPSYCLIWTPLPLILMRRFLAAAIQPN
jgi:hypothetical protein